MPTFNDAGTSSETQDGSQGRKFGWRSLTIAFATLVLTVVIPLLEVNETHLYSRDWPAHARFHEAWQLLTNAGLSVTALWLAVVRGRERLGAALALIIVGALLIAYASAGLYGGSISRPGSDDLSLLGLNVPVLVMALLAAILLAAIAPKRG